MFMNLAHRGASHYAPENTMAAFYKGIELGANGIETDIRISKDGVVFLHHDKELDRTTNATGAPSDYTWKELQELDAGSWYSPLYAGERVVSLEQFLHLFGRKSLLIVLELKDPDIEEPVLELINHYGIRDKVTLTSFKYDYIQAVRAKDATLKIGQIVKKIDEEAIGLLKEIGAQQICPKIQQLTAEDVVLAKLHGLEVRACGIKASEELMQHALNCGVAGMTINNPDALVRALSAKTQKTNR